MAYDFPSSPIVGQTYQQYTWDGEKWTWIVSVTGGTGGSGGVAGGVDFSVAGNPMTTTVLEDF